MHTAHSLHTAHCPPQFTGADVYIRHAMLLLISFVGLCFFFFLLMQLAQGPDGAMPTPLSSVSGHFCLIALALSYLHYAAVVCTTTTT